MPYHRLTAAELARRLQTDLPAVEALLDERASVTAELAERLAALFALPPHYWLALQRQHDLWQSMDSPRAA